MSIIYTLLFRFYTLNCILTSFRSLKLNSERDIKFRVTASERRRQIKCSLQVWLCWVSY